MAVVEQDRALRIEWTPPATDGGSPVEGYQVVVVPQDKAVPTPPKMMLSERRSSISVGSLANGTRYSVRVRAFNSAGKGARGVATGTPHTTASAPAIGPLTAGTQAVIVRWTAPAADGGAPVSSYLVTAWPSGSVMRVGHSVRSARFAGLRNGEPTSFTVAASNRAGTGASSARSGVVVPRGYARLTLLRQPARRVVYGNSTYVQAAMVRSDGRGVAWQTVQLHARVRGTDRWRWVATGTTGWLGRVTLRARLPLSADLRLHHPPSNIVPRTLGAGRVVVAKRITSYVRTTRTRLGMTVVVRGSVRPVQRAGSVVRLQRRVDGAWAWTATGRMLTRGRYVIRWDPSRVGRYVLRALVPAAGARAPGATAGWWQRVNPETVADIARDILHDEGVTLSHFHVSAGSDGATPLQNIVDVANGRLAHTSCYGGTPCRTTTLDRRMLGAVREIGRRGTLTVSEFAGGRHAGGSAHYSGRAVDINWVNGRHVGWSSGYGMAVDICRKYGADTIYAPAMDPWGGHSRHVHCAWS